MEDEEEWNANCVDEHADHDLGNVQSQNSVTNSLFGEWSVGLFTLVVRIIPCDHP